MAATTGLDRFVQKSSPNDCWNWMGYRSKLGYGKVFINGKSVYSHRAAWERANGTPVPDGLVVMHSCDNRACCNPKHLSVGTQKQNCVDAVSRGRRDQIKHLSGSDCPWAKLTERDVEEIRSKTLSPKEIQQIYGLSRSYSYEIARYKNTWQKI